MKIFPLLMLASAILLGGCATPDNASQASADSGTRYVSLGSNIPKKNAQPADAQKVDLQQLENARAMNSSAINGPGSR